MKARMTRREAISTMGRAALAGVGGALLGGCNGGGSSGMRRPNIIFIMADDLGYGDLGCYGQQVIQTPNLDQMAEEGMRFTDCYAGSAVCAPSRCCLMTGLHTGHCRVRANRPYVALRPEDVTVAEVLRSAGYRTGLIGKWHLGQPRTTGMPSRQGFAYSFGYLEAANQGNHYPEYLYRNGARVPLPGNLNGGRQQYADDLFTKEAIRFIQQRANAAFFLVLSYKTPHANITLGQETGDGMEVPDYGQYAGEPWPQPQKGYAAMISRMDKGVGRVLEVIREQEIDEQTAVFFTSDNGPHNEGGAAPAFFNSAGPLRGIKTDLYEGGIRVPMIVRWPGVVSPGTVSDQPWAFWDVLPTAAEIAGIPPPGTDGVSMVPALERRRPATRDHLYWELFHEGKFRQAVRMGKWKAVRIGRRQPTELYDLSCDLGETHNLAGQHPSRVGQAGELFEAMRTHSPDFPSAQAAGRAS